MKPNVVLTVSSLLTLLFLTFHMTHDVIRQVEGSVQYPIPVIVFALWLYGTVMLSDRVWGHVIMLIGGLFGAGMIVVHSKGLVMRNSGGFFFTWTLFALSTTGLVTMALSIRGLWMKFRSRPASQLGSATGMTADH
ncbi:MAG TPA: hypothetical protein VK636_01410 [Gemmatimonadaceae bacterium]|nr:hypothetical protein [Gemmatimonadaceae bacterium]